jgi:hypothetical protein
MMPRLGPKLGLRRLRIRPGGMLDPCRGLTGFNEVVLAGRGGQGRTPKVSDQVGG